MVIVTACLLVAIASGVTSALSVASSNIFESCKPRTSSREDEDAVDDTAQQDRPVLAGSQQLTTTALVPFSSRPGVAFCRVIGITPGSAPAPASEPAAIATTISKWFNMFMPRLYDVEEDDAEAAAREVLRRQMIVVRRQLQQQQQQQQQRDELHNFRAVSNALVPFDHSSVTTRAAVAPSRLSTPTSRAISPRDRTRTREPITSPRSRSGRPSSPRRSVTVARVSAVTAGSAPHVTTTSPCSRAISSFASQDATSKLGPVSISTTPPLTPASAVSSPAVPTSARPNPKTSKSFFACSYHGDGGNDSTHTSSHEEDPEAVRTRAQVKLGDESEVRDGMTSKVKPEAGDFDAIVNGAKPGQQRRLFLHNLRESQAGGLGHICAEVRKAQVALGGNGEHAGVLQEGAVLGEGSFGIVKDARHSVVPGEFAVKMLKKGAAWNARYCATVEMIAMARLAKTPHDNVIGAISIDDREGPNGMMPILLPKADADFGAVLRRGVWSMPAKLRCLQQAASGVRHMHGQGIGHGDIKPENLLMVNDGQGGWVAKLCDFGMSRALGETRPQMMGTPAFMPLEVMLESVATHESQDVFALGVLALLVCVSPETAQSNMFISPELYTSKEAKKKQALEVKGVGDGCPILAAQREMFERDMMKRTMSDGSFARLMTVDNLHPDLGSFETKFMVSLCLPPFMDTNPASRPDTTSYETVMGNFATAAEEAVAEERTDQAGPEDELGESDVGMDLDGDDEDYEDNDLF